MAVTDQLQQRCGCFYALHLPVKVVATFSGPVTVPYRCQDRYGKHPDVSEGCQEVPIKVVQLPRAQVNGAAFHDSQVELCIG
jgi:hypothetical protein